LQSVFHFEYAHNVMLAVSTVLADHVGSASILAFLVLPHFDTPNRFPLRRKMH